MKGIKIVYSDQELAWVKSHCTLPVKELHTSFCKEFNRSDVNPTNVNALRKRNGWKTGRTGRFEKGNTPHPNARPKGPNKTSFAKGKRPHNWRPVGSTRISKDGYIEVKTAEPRKWELKHIVEWVKQNGAVQDGYCVSMIDGCKTNCELNNLELISRNANLQINRIKPKLDVNEETLPVIRNIGKLIAKTNERQKEV